MLYCCSRYFSQTEKKFLLDTYSYSNRVLEYGFCPVCNTLKACLTQTDSFGKRKEVKPKKRQAKNFIESCLKQPYFDNISLSIKFGSKQNMYWLYQSDGVVKDFNDVKKGSCLSNIKCFT